MTNDDPFAELVRSEGTMHFKAKQRARDRREAAKQPMVLSPQEQKLADTSVQMRRYRKGKREDLKALAMGENGERWRELILLLRHITLETEFDLVDYVRSQDWLLTADIKIRQTYLSTIADRMFKLRIQNGYPPFSDSLLGEPPTTFEIIRNDLRVMT